MEVAVSEWVPATEAELAMRDALRSGDQELYFRILARTDLLLPVSADALAGRAPMGWGTWTSGERTHVLAFSSPEAMSACLAEHAGSARRVPYHELAQNWPNHDWWLAVNPGLPIEGYLPAWFVAQLARGDVRLPGHAAPTRARIERVESFQRSRTVSAVPQRGPALPTVEPEAAPTAPRYGHPPPRHSEPDPGESGGSAHSENGPRRPPLPQRIPRPVDPAPDDASVHAAPAVPEAATTEPDFDAANDVEATLFAAAEDGNTDQFLSTLLLAKVLVPVPPASRPGARPGDDGFQWLTDNQDGQPYVVVFTSDERLVDHLGEQCDTVVVSFVQLIRHWPDDDWSFAVNPGTPVGAKLPGAQIVALASWAAEVGLTGETEEEPVAGSAPDPVPVPSRSAPVPTPSGPTMMQKVIPPGQVDYYVERGYDRVSGFVYRAAELAHLRTPAELFTALGVKRRDTSEAHVLRWAAHRPNLYRIPYGGPHEDAMRAMQGWVIERPPFRGNGFAPAESGDIIAEFKVDSVRLPHGAQLWRVDADGTEALVALLDADGPLWRRVDGGEP